MSFQDLGLSPDLLKAIEDSGYTTPTPIQAKAIPYVLMGRDVLGCAQTGTGKTASFTLPMIEIMANGRSRARMPRSLILEPTRELAAQVAESFKRYGKYHKLSMALLIGGTSMDDQMKALERGVDVLIATPGRLLDLYERGKIILADVRILVIDETDRMLDMGFIPDVERIVGLLPKIRQTLFFSATMPPEIRRLGDAFLMNPKEIAVDPPSSAAATVEQRLLRVSATPKDKRAAFRELLRAQGVESGLVFCNRKRDVGVLYRSLLRHGFSAGEMHGDMAQSARMATLDRFKKGEIKLLVCSDVAARGLDIPAMSHVFNFDVPVNAEDYIHRIGRTGRAGRSGRAFTLAGPQDSKQLAAVTRLIGRKIEEVRLDGTAPQPIAETPQPVAEAPQPSVDAAQPQAETPQPQEARQEGAKPKSRSRRRGRGRDRDKAKEQPREAPRQAEEQPRKERPQAKDRPRDEPRRSDSGAETRAGEVKRFPAGERDTRPFGEHTPAFMLRDSKRSASA